MIITMVVAATVNGVIGRDGALPWRLRRDLRRFKRLTTGHTIIMGRKTWESIGKPLPKRTSIVLTRNPDYQLPEGVLRADSLASALRQAEGDPDVFIIGGEAVYKEGMRVADRIELTRVLANVEGDAYFPMDQLQSEQWSLWKSVGYSSDEKNEYPVRYETYQRNWGALAQPVASEN